MRSLLPLQLSHPLTEGGDLLGLLLGLGAKTGQFVGDELADLGVRDVSESRQELEPSTLSAF